MLVVQVDRLHSQPPQAGFAGAADVIKLNTDAANIGIGRVADDAEFCGENNLVALAFDRFANEFFVFVRAVGVSRVEKVNAEFESSMNGGDGLVIVAPAVEL